jgi:hypothetical protein
MKPNWTVNNPCHTDHDLKPGDLVLIHSGGIKSNGTDWSTTPIGPGVTTAMVTHRRKRDNRIITYDLVESGDQLTATSHSGGGSWTATEG